MMTYFATFIAGCHEIVQNRLRRFNRAELEITELHDGLVIFTSSLSPNQLAELRFFTNVYELLQDYGATMPEPGELAVPQLTGTFIVRVRKAGQPAPIPEELKQAIAQKSGAQFASHRPANELLLVQRADGRVLWGRMLPKAGFKSRRIEPGELKPELAHMLGLVAGLDGKDIVLDPFAGYGGIVRECLQGFHCEHVLAVEQNEHLIPHLKSIPRLVAMQGEAGQLGHIPTRSVDRVVTDPPWGNFETHTEHGLRHLYKSALVQMHRVLRVKGAVVMLSAAEFVSEVAAECAFDVVKQIPILVNGQKATIYKLRKLGG